jgi:hypothetical protein
MRSDVKRSTDSAARCSPSLAAVGASGQYGDPGRGVSGSYGDPGRGVSGSYGGTGRGVSGSYGQGAGGANLARSQATRDGKKRNTTERQLPPARSGVRCHFSRGFVCI